MISANSALSSELVPRATTKEVGNTDDESSGSKDPSLPPAEGTTVGHRMSTRRSTLLRKSLHPIPSIRNEEKVDDFVPQRTVQIKGKAAEEEREGCKGASTSPSLLPLKTNTDDSHVSSESEMNIDSSPDSDSDPKENGSVDDMMEDDESSPKIPPNSTSQGMYLRTCLHVHVCVSARV